MSTTVPFILPTREGPLQLDQITEDVFLSDYESAIEESLLMKHQIKTIVYVSEHEKPNEVLEMYQRLGITHHHLFCYDSPYEKISKLFEPLQRLMADAKVASNQPVLFHCMSGISRSPTLVIVHLLQSSMPFADAFDLVRQKRVGARIKPNDGFQKQLQQYSVEWKTKKVEPDANNNP